MSRWAYILVLLVLTEPALAARERRYEIPDLGPDYRQPVTTTPPGRMEVQEYVDVAALAVALAAASYLALKRRSRAGLVVLGVMSLAYFGFYRKGCVCSIGAIQNVSLALAGSGYVVPLVVLAFFVLPLVSTLLFGRTFCAAVCPLGAIQDVVVLRPVKVPGAIEQALGLLAYVYLAGAVVLAATDSAFIICRYDPFVSFFRLSGSAGMLVVGACALVIGMFVARPYCRFLCPYGALLRWCSRVARWHVTITPDECIRCRLCEDACPVGAIRPATAEPPGHDRRQGRLRLAGALALLPVLVVLGALLGRAGSGGMARTHATVSLAERVALEDRVGRLAEWVADQAGAKAMPKGGAPAVKVEQVEGALWVGAQDRSTGQVLWRRPVPAAPGGAATSPAGASQTAVAAADAERAYLLVRSPSGAGGEEVSTLLCLDARDGRELWRRTVGESTVASDAFRRGGQSAEDLQAQAGAIRAGFAPWGAAMGGFVGLIVAGRLIHLCVRRRRIDYEADRAACVSCGRCFRYCPREHLRLRKLQEPARASAT